MQLTKHHGLANDFLVVLDEVNGRGLAVDGELAVRVCDRRLGVGADGLIHGAAPPAGSDADVVMHLYNADGSRAEMSGNGVRCLAQAIALAHEERELHLVVATDGGLRQVLIIAADVDSQVAHAEAHMGKVGPGPAMSPAVIERLEAPGPNQARRYATADVGNPHLVVEVDDPGAVEVAELGTWIDQRVPGGINVEFAAPDRAGADRLIMRVWERGAGLTQACGTGACATASVFHAWGWRSAGGDADRAGQDPAVEVSMPGGDATVTLLADGEAVLSGPVHHVATLEIPDA